MQTRRHFIASGVAASLATGLAPANKLDELLYARMYVMPDKLHLATFQGTENSVYRAHLENGEIADLTLAEVKDERERFKEASEAFTLLFKTKRALPQKIYRLEHDRAGVLHLFLVPVGQEGDSYLMEAVFNRMDA